MWLSYLGDYLVFLLEVVTIVVAIVMVIGAIASAKEKGVKAKQEGRLVIKSLHKKFQAAKKLLEATVLSKTDLKAIQKKEKAEAKEEKKKDKQHPDRQHKHIYVIEFSGDIQASQVSSLKEEVTAIIQVATPDDEVVVKLESGGGVVHGYGLAASQLARIKNSGIPLTVCVDKVAASGGYMMAVLADKIIAAPFAILGSIGVVGQMPNFNRFLEQHGVDVEQHTAGKYKRTLTMLGKNTDEGREKFKDHLEDVHHLFRDHIHQYREQLDLDKVTTGEYWFGHQALELKLVDELMTSDDYLLKAYESDHAQLYEVKYEIKKGKLHQLSGAMEKLFIKTVP